MSTRAKDLLAKVISDAERELKLLGFRKTKSVFVCPLGDHAFGWLGFNTATQRSDGRVGINPVVGVRHERIERMVEEFLGESESRFGPTLSTAVGYLMPEGRYLEWLFESAPFDYQSQCRRMVKAVEVYGIPFMKANSALEGILRDLEQLRFSSRDTAIYRLPIAHLLAGKTGLAVSYVNKQMKELGDRNDLAARQYKLFASRLLQEASLK